MNEADGISWKKMMKIKKKSTVKEEKRHRDIKFIHINIKNKQLCTLISLSTEGIKKELSSASKFCIFGSKGRKRKPS